MPDGCFLAQKPSVRVDIVYESPTDNKLPTLVSGKGKMGPDGYVSEDAEHIERDTAMGIGELGKRIDRIVAGQFTMRHQRSVRLN